MLCLFSPRPRDLPEESHKDETRREDEASLSHYYCNLHLGCGVVCKLVNYIHSQLSMRLLSIEWFTLILKAFSFSTSLGLPALVSSLLWLK